MLAIVCNKESNFEYRSDREKIKKVIGRITPKNCPRDPRSPTGVAVGRERRGRKERKRRGRGKEEEEEETRSV